MYYLYRLINLKVCFQTESQKNITKSKQSRKFFVSPVKFTKVHVRGFENEPTIWGKGLKDSITHMYKVPKPHEVAHKKNDLDLQIHCGLVVIVLFSCLTTEHKISSAHN